MEQGGMVWKGPKVKIGMYEGIPTKVRATWEREKRRPGEVISLSPLPLTYACRWCLTPPLAGQIILAPWSTGLPASATPQLMEAR